MTLAEELRAWYAFLLGQASTARDGAMAGWAYGYAEAALERGDEEGALARLTWMKDTAQRTNPGAAEQVAAAEKAGPVVMAYPEWMDAETADWIARNQAERGLLDPETTTRIKLHGVRPVPEGTVPPEHAGADDVYPVPESARRGEQPGAGPVPPDNDLTQRASNAELRRALEEAMASGAGDPAKVPAVVRQSDFDPAKSYGPNGVMVVPDALNLPPRDGDPATGQG